MSERDCLRADELRAALNEAYIGNEIVVVAEIASTNDFAWQMAQAGKPAGLVVIAEKQSAGRGQRGNRWESAAGLGLWLSILLRPGIEPGDSARLTNWAASSIARAIMQEVGIEPRIKMPNDVYIAQRKVAGVLVEMRVEQGGSYAAIVGIGVNVNQETADFPEIIRGSAGSLAMAADRKIDRQSFAVALLQNLDRSYRAAFAV